MSYADSIDPVMRRFPPAASVTPPPANISVDLLDLTSRLRLRLAELGVVDLHGLHGVKRQQLAVYEVNLWAEIEWVLEISGYDLRRGSRPRSRFT